MSLDFMLVRVWFTQHILGKTTDKVFNSFITLFIQSFDRGSQTMFTVDMKWFLKQKGQQGLSNGVPSPSLSGTNNDMVHPGNYKEQASLHVIVVQTTCQSSRNLSARGRRWTTGEGAGVVSTH